MQNACQKFFEYGDCPQSLVLCGFRLGADMELHLNEIFTEIVNIEVYLQTMKF